MMKLIVVLFLISAIDALSCATCVLTSAMSAATFVSGMVVPQQTSFTKGKTATTMVALKNARFYYDTTTWSVLSDEIPNEAVDYQFMHSDGNVRAIAMSLREFVPMNEFIDGFISGMQEDAPETKLLSRRDVKVNGSNMVEVKIEMVTPDAPIMYYGYLHTGAKGVSLALGLCHRDLFSEVEATIANFVSGLVIESPTPTPDKPAKKTKK